MIYILSAKYELKVYFGNAKFRLMSLDQSLFDYQSYKSYLSDLLAAGPRGLQTQLAAAISCQPTYLIRVLRDKPHLTEDQGFRAARFLKLSSYEFEYFLNLVRFGRASDEGLRQYYASILKSRASSAQQVKNRIRAEDVETSLQSQVTYYSSWQPSIIHLATSCPHLQTARELAQRFLLDIEKVREILEFLRENGLVKFETGKYQHAGKSIHLPKGSPLHRPFQRVRRERIYQSLERDSEDDLHFSSAFATSRKHIRDLRATFLKMIEESHRDLEKTKSEELMLFALDFCRAT